MANVELMRVVAVNGENPTGKIVKTVSLSTVPDLKAYDLSALASMVQRNWKAVNFAAKPYLSAMLGLASINDPYGMDSGRSIVAYFLSNAGTWKGETAKAVKAELKRRLNA